MGTKVFQQFGCHRLSDEVSAHKYVDLHDSDMSRAARQTVADITPDHLRGVYI